MKEIVATALLLLLMAFPAAQETRREDDGCAPGFSIDIRGVAFRRRAPAENQPLESAVADAEQLQALTALLDATTKYKDYKYTISGHTDTEECSGSDCAALSLRRSQAVRDWLVAKGASPALFVAVTGAGADRPIDANDTEEQRARNRRVEFDLVF